MEKPYHLMIPACVARLMAGAFAVQDILSLPVTKFPPVDSAPAAMAGKLKIGRTQTLGKLGRAMRSVPAVLSMDSPGAIETTDDNRSRADRT